MKKIILILCILSIASHAADKECYYVPGGVKGKKLLMCNIPGMSGIMVPESMHKEGVIFAHDCFLKDSQIMLVQERCKSNTKKYLEYSAGTCLRLDKKALYEISVVCDGKEAVEVIYNPIRRLSEKEINDYFGRNQ